MYFVELPTGACANPTFTMSSTEKVAYDANCHCGAVKFTVNIPSLEVEEVTRCNCSICTRNGYLNVFPRREDVVFHSGESQLASYLFGEKRRAHRFCPTCGTSVLIDFQNAESEAEKPYMAVNVSVMPNHSHQVS